MPKAFGDAFKVASELASNLAEVVTGGRQIPTHTTRPSAPQPTNNNTEILSGIVASTTGVQQVRITSDRPLTEPPPLDPSHVARQAAEEALRKVLEESRWVHVWGSIRTGKTSLVRRVVGESPATWLHHRGLDADKCLHQLRSLNLARGNRSEAQVLAKSLSRNGFLVADDIPDLSNSNHLADFLLIVARHLPDDRRILTTGVHPLPSRLRTAQWVPQVSDLRVPKLTFEEAQAFFLAAGAPSEVADNDQRIKVVLSFAESHIERFRHLLRLLRDNDWQWNEGTFRTLTVPTEDRRADILKIVTLMTPDTGARELLFRLCAYDEPFGHEDVLAVGLVDPVLSHPGTLQAGLDGLWLDRESPLLRSVSPTIKPLGEAELDPNVRCSVHEVVAKRYLSRGSLTPLMVLQSIAHFQKANQPDAAGGVYIRALLSLIDERAFHQDMGLAHLWSYKLPAGMRPEVQMFVRALQVKVAFEKGDEAKEPVERLYAVVDSLSSIQRWAWLSVIWPYEAIAAVDLNRASSLLKKAFLSPTDPSLSLPRDMEHVFWATAWIHLVFMKRPDHVDPWLEVLDCVPAGVHAEWNESEEFALGINLLTKRLLFEESALPEEKRDYARLEEVLQNIAMAGDRLNLSILSGGAVAAQISLRAEHCGDIAYAKQLFETKISSLRDELPRAFLMDAYGGCLVRGGENPEGVSWLSQALTSYKGHNFFKSNYFHALMVVYRGTAHTNQQDALDIAKQGVEFAKANPDHVSSLDRFSALAELAVAWFNVGDLHESWVSFDKAAVLLFSLEQTSLWRDRFVLFGHVSGYLSSMAMNNTPPSEGPAGKAYAAPAPGMFFTGEMVERQALFKPELVGLLPHQLAAFALSVDDFERAFEWSERALEFSTKAGLFHLNAVSNRMLVIKHLWGAEIDRALVCFQDARLAFDVHRPSTRNAKDFWKPTSQIYLKDLSPQALIAALAWLRLFAITASMVGVLSIEDLDVRINQAGHVRTFCLKMADVAIDGGAWRSMADFAFAVGKSPEIQRGILEPHCAKSQAQANPELWALAHLFMALPRVGESPEKRLVHHFQAARFFEQHAEEMDITYGLVVVRYFVEYWGQFARSSGFLIRNPRRTRAELETVANSPLSDRLRHTLLVMMDGLGVGASDWARNWLLTGEE